MRGNGDGEEEGMQRAMPTDKDPLSSHHRATNGKLIRMWIRWKMWS